MNTHQDFDHKNNFLKRLEERADETRAAGEATITGGLDDEAPLAEWQANGVHVKQLPADEQGILRISIGGGDDTAVPLNYLVFRGSHGKCVDLLRRALRAISCPRD